MELIIKVGDQVLLDCTAESKALSSLKNRLAGRVGLVISEDRALGFPDSPHNYTVRFPRMGRKLQVDLDLHFSVLIKYQPQQIREIMINALELLDMADQQLRGFGHAYKGYGVIDLVSSMGLKAEEWDALRERAKIYLPEECVDNIDDYFSGDKL